MPTENRLQLPAGFEQFGALAAHWARPSEHERNRIRWAANKLDFAQLYEAFMPRLGDALALLATQPLDQMEEPVRNLFHLVCAFAEAAPHHELYGGSPEVPFSFSALRFVPGHGDLPSEATALR